VPTLAPTLSSDTASKQSRKRYNELIGMIEEWKEETISLSRKQKSLRSFGREDAESFKEKILSERAKTQAADAGTPNQQMIDEPEGEEETKQEQPRAQSEDTNMHDVPNEEILN